MGVLSICLHLIWTLTDALHRQSIDVARGSCFAFIDASYLAMSGIFREKHMLMVFRFAAEDGLQTGHVVTLHMPPRTWRASILESYTPPPPTPPQSAVFWPDPAQRMVALRLEIVCPDAPSTRFQRLRRGQQTDHAAWHWHHVLLLIPRNTFRTQVQHGDFTCSLSPGNIPEIPWNDWGSDGSILVRYDGRRELGARDYRGQWFLPFGSRLTFRAPPGTESSLITVDANPLSKLHPSHSGCTRKDMLARIEDFSDTGDSFLKTVHPRSYYIRPAFPDVARLIYARYELPCGVTVSVSQRPIVIYDKKLT